MISLRRPEPNSKRHFCIAPIGVLISHGRDTLPNARLRITDAIELSVATDRDANLESSIRLGDYGAATRDGDRSVRGFGGLASVRRERCRYP